jgi:hypothetical protein
MENLEKEIQLLERKLELLKLIKEAQDQIQVAPQPIYVPYPAYPIYPSYPLNPVWEEHPYTVWTDKTTAGNVQFSYTN